VSNHSVKEEVIEEHWLQNKAFFNLPLEDKLTIVADSNNRYVKQATSSTQLMLIHSAPPSKNQKKVGQWSMH